MRRKKKKKSNQDKNLTLEQTAQKLEESASLEILKIQLGQALNSLV